MIRVEEADKIIQSHVRGYGTETVSLNKALAKVLAEDILADRDLPPYNRVTMDGIAIKYESHEKGIKSFVIKATQAAGDVPIDIHYADECIEIMTGAALSPTTDTIIPYEELILLNGMATVKDGVIIKKGQSIHPRGIDKKKNDILATAGSPITPAIINATAGVGKTGLIIRRAPRVVIISTGDELVDLDEAPSPYQVRRSNNYAVKAVLQQQCVDATMIHLPDNIETIKMQLEKCLAAFDVILLSGGVSMGKFDYVPSALEQLGVTAHFHKIQQRPGKPLWFGTHSNGAIIFAFPGNPASTFMCMYRYFLPWLKASMGILAQPALNAMLNKDVVFTPPLQYFIQVILSINRNGQLLATPLAGNGSGDFTSLVEANAFMELPLEQSSFKSGQVFTVWPYSNFIAG